MERVTLLGIVMLLVLSGRAQAQEPQPRVPAWARLAFASALVGDQASTIATAATVHRYSPAAHIEGNPAIGWMEPHVGVTGEMVIGGIAELALLHVACRLWCAHHPRLMTALTVVGTMTHSVAMVQNLQARADYQRWARYYYGH